ncbi:MAG: bifunctional glutamate N-acetyltransferase/amino-acid acetyltransferase ArgJ [Phycisphaerae bacterium]
MSDNQYITAARGFLAGALHCGIKQSSQSDLAMLVSSVPATAAAVFTTNKVVGAPVVVGRKHIQRGVLSACVINSGCANVCTGKRGIADALQMCTLTSEALAKCDMVIPPEDILPSSTGIIGHFLPMKEVRSGILSLAPNLGCSILHGEAFAHAILTTDLKCKIASTQFTVGRRTITMAGCCKGSGMIAPNMATMLAYVATDAAISSAALQAAVRDTADTTFNCLTVDQHTSTSDTYVVLANGLAENPRIELNTAAWRSFSRALETVCDSLARQIAADGEGATKLVIVRVTGADTDADARRAAMAIANSPLVKTAIHGGDPNWGRFVSAAGYSGAKMNPDKSRCQVGDITVFRNGQPTTPALADVATAMKNPEVHITVSLGTGGKGVSRVYTCDLSREYIAINADYHT